MTENEEIGCIPTVGASAREQIVRKQRERGARMLLEPPHLHVERVARRLSGLDHACVCALDGVKGRGTHNGIAAMPIF